MERARLVWPLSLSLVLGLAFALRLPSLLEGFWIDEVMSAAIIADRWDLMLTRIGFTDVHPPGYYLILKLWSLIFGGSDVALRGLSMVAGLSTIWLLMLWLRQREGVGVVIVAGLLLACSPFHAHYSVEVRSYALFTLVALSLAFAVERFLRSQASPPPWLIIGLEIATLSLHYYGLFWVALINVHVIASTQSRVKRLRWFGWQCVSLAFFALWLPLLFVQLFELPELMKSHLSDELPLTRVIASLGPLPSLRFDLLALMSGALVLVLALVGVWLRRGERSDSESGDGEEVRWSFGESLLLALWLLFAPLAPLAVLPMSDALLEAYMRQLPWSYAALIVTCGLGAMLSLKPLVRLRLPLVPWLMMSGPLLVLVLHQVQPMLFLRNLLVFVPLVLMCAVFALARAPKPILMLLSVAIVAAGGASATMGSEAFMPRQDFKGVAAALDLETEVEVLVAPAWDVPGVERYSEGRVITPLMHAEELTGRSGHSGRLLVLLTRPERHRLSEAEIAASLGSDWSLEQGRSFRGHRGSMRWLLYRSRVEAEAR